MSKLDDHNHQEVDKYEIVLMDWLNWQQKKSCLKKEKIKIFETIKIKPTFTKKRKPKLLINLQHSCLNLEQFVCRAKR